MVEVNRLSGPSPLHTITAFATDTRLVLRQRSVGEMSNEIPAVPILLQLLELEGAVVTLDAMHTQVQTAKAIIESEADDVLCLKQNQPHSHGGAPEVAVALRRLSLNILQQDTSLQESIRGKRLRAGWDEAVLDGIYQAFQAA